MNFYYSQVFVRIFSFFLRFMRCFDTYSSHFAPHGVYITSPDMHTYLIENEFYCETHDKHKTAIAAL